MIIGIDPGLTGAVALVNTSSRMYLCESVADLPTADKEVGGGKELDPVALHELLAGLPYRAPVVIERVRAMPAMTVTGKQRKMGAQSMFNFGEGAGIIRAVVTLSGRRYAYVEPAAWKRRAGLIGQPKDRDRTLAIELYPEVANRLKFKKHHGRADAILIATFGRPDLDKEDIFS